ncbi:protease domain-containing protein, partial [Pseudoxanthomonas sangjuensis]
MYETDQDGSRIVPGEFIVVFEEDALAGYDGSIPGYPRPARAKGKARLDVKGREARNYVSYLQGRQAEHEATIGRALGHQLQVKRRMQHALNAVVANMSNAEAGKVRKMKGVKLVEPVKLEKLNTDVGPWLIGAGEVWNWTGSGAGFPASGEGVVVGMLDTGINYASPSFAAVDPFDGYVHKNPLGSGHYLGTCAPGGVDEGHCNDKLIGGYDYIGEEYNDGEPGFFDNNGHGSHTASTAAGNHRDQMFMSEVRHISGVAPRANIVAFDVCHGGSCPTDAAVAAVNQAIADGVVDVINFSISGGEDPWDESVSLAFLNATDAGIYVATAAGNDGPDPGWIGHVEPWTASTAAAQHGRGAIGFGVQIMGPGTVPDALKSIAATMGVESMQPAGPIDAPLVLSPGIDTASDGCNGYPADTFKEAIAVVRRAGCSFAIKVNNATAAGAVAVVIANNVDGSLLPSAPGTTIPFMAVSKADGDAIRDWAKAHPGTTARIGSVTFTNKPDVLAEFSSRGPAANYDLITPDLTAPGVDILATVAGSAEAIGIYSGTSMASPHNAGAAALLRQLHPDWTPAEIKSALALTATTIVYMEDGTTQATPFDMGSGRIRVDKAAQAGLVMNETTANFVGFTPVFTDTYEKADQGHEECSCRSEGSSAPSSSAVRLSRPAS